MFYGEVIFFPITWPDMIPDCHDNCILILTIEIHFFKWENLLNYKFYNLCIVFKIQYRYEFLLQLQLNPDNIISCPLNRLLLKNKKYIFSEHCFSNCFSA